MARQHFWQYLINTEGQPIEGATINVYNAGTTTSAYVFLAETGGSATQTPAITTDAEGFFEFWIGDNTEEHGYVAGSKFKITWSKPGSITTGEIDNVDFFIDKNKAAIYTETVETTTLSSDVSGSFDYSVTITHDLNNLYPMVICYDDDTKQSVTIMAQSIDENNTKVYRTGQKRCHVTIIG